MSEGHIRRGKTSCKEPDLSALQRFCLLSECKTKAALPRADTTLLRRAVERPTPSPLQQRLKFSHQINCSHRKRTARAAVTSAPVIACQDWHRPCNINKTVAGLVGNFDVRQ